MEGPQLTPEDPLDIGCVILTFPLVNLRRAPAACVRGHMGTRWRLSGRAPQAVPCRQPHTAGRGPQAAGYALGGLNPGTPDRTAGSDRLCMLQRRSTIVLDRTGPDASNFIRLRGMPLTSAGLPFLASVTDVVMSSAVV